MNPNLRRRLIVTITINSILYLFDSLYFSSRHSPHLSSFLDYNPSPCSHKIVMAEYHYYLAYIYLDICYILKTVGRGVIFEGALLTSNQKVRVD